MHDADSLDDRRAFGKMPDMVSSMRGMAMLKPKGACWYCNQPLDNVRRFCGKACANDYRTEEEAFSQLDL